VPTFTVRSTLAAPPSAVLARALTMPGVNAELAPLVRMTYPPEAEVLDVTRVPLGKVAFRSVLLLFGVLPVDLHALVLVHVDPARGFHECSHSLLQRYWEHERTVEPGERGGCVVTDRVDFAPRLHGVGWLLRPVMRAVFRHRHRRLAAAFGRLGVLDA
jgi:ligand-binding SRPBCC domain-containing protein